MSFQGFRSHDQEIKYTLTLFDLLLTLSARVTAVLNSSKPPFQCSHGRRLQGRPGRA